MGLEDEVGLNSNCLIWRWEVLCLCEEEKGKNEMEIHKTDMKLNKIEKER